jgi:1,4-alpha-glucan branching enzyme
MAIPTNNLIVQELGAARCAVPFDFLGLHEHPGGKGLLLRVWRPGSESIEVIDTTRKKSLGEMQRVDSSDLFVMEFPRRRRSFPYVLRVKEGGGLLEVVDPYDFGHALAESPGIDPHRLQDTLGARPGRLSRDSRGLSQGVLFSVYAPAARAVSIVGDFNNWDGRSHPMQGSEKGVWRLFIPGLGAGTLYKFELKGPDGDRLPAKADPFGFYAEQPPGNSSIVHDRYGYQWRDREWCMKRDSAGYRDDQPMSIYEVHLGSWMRHADGRHLSYRELVEKLLPYVNDMGFTHVELLPVMEHPFLGSWGYQTTGMYAPTSRFGSPDDFKYFVDCCHGSGIGVILDWVPAHFPADEHALSQFDGTTLFEHADPRRGWHPDWDTLIYDYGSEFVRNFLVSSSLFWIEEYHADGIRVDAVASMLYLDYSREEGEWVPNIHGGNENLEAIRFIREMNEVLHSEHPGVLTIAEESTAWPKVSKPTYDDGLGFGFKWNMGWMHDTLSYMSRDPVHRKFHHDELTFGMLYAYDEHFVLPLSHDEVVHGKGSLLAKMPGDEWQKHANLRLYCAWMYAFPGKKMLFMGGEFGQIREWDHDGELDWSLLEDQRHEGLRRLVCDLNSIYRSRPSLFEADYEHCGFDWIDPSNSEMSVISFMRSAPGRDEPVIVVSNMTPGIHHNFRLGVPLAGNYKELLNTDSQEYGGSNVGNGGGVTAEERPLHGLPFSLVLTLPPLATLFLSVAGLPERKQAGERD